MKAQKVRDLDEHEIKQQLKEMDEQMFRLHFQMSMGQMEGLKKVRQMKKDRARIYTILRERELAGEKRVRPCGYPGMRGPCLQTWRWGMNVWAGP